jgi:PAT family beta-lactamase induction signal transducer AmpG
MSLCDRRFTATQYALLTSLMAITRVIVGAPTGYLVKAFGWEIYFLVCMLAAVPGLLLLLQYSRWTAPSPTTIETAIASPRS